MEKKKKKGLKIAISVILLVILAVGAGAAYYLYRQVNSGLFFKETKINGYDVSDKTCKEVLLMLEQDYSTPKITVTESGETAEVLTLADMGYTINEKKLLSSIESCMRDQNVSLLFSLMDGNTFEVEIPFDYDEATFKANVCAAKFAKPRVASTDATMEYDGKEYYIKPETYGTEFDDADLQVMIKDTADKLVAADRPQKDVTVEFPSGLYYVPAVTQNDSEMNTTMNIYNSFCKADIRLTFGDEQEEIDWSTIKDWLTIEDGEGVIDEEAVYNYVYDLAAKYDTLYYAREFTTHDGRTIDFDSSDYGYQIDKDGEAEQLLTDIRSNTEVEREPVYAVKGYKREGKDDLCGNYVEVDLTAQHLWFYKDGELVVETDVVTGLPKDGRETATGQETPVTLLRVMQDIGFDNVGINLDPANLIMYGKANPVDSLDVFGKYVRGVHGKDGLYPTDGRELGDEVALGEGKVNFPVFLKKLHELGYDGDITIEREITGEQQKKDIQMAKKMLDEIISGLE